MAPPSDTVGDGGGLSEAERLAVEASAAAAAAEAAAGIEAANEAARAAQAAEAEAAATAQAAEAQRNEFIIAIGELQNWFTERLDGLLAGHETLRNLIVEQSQALGSLILALPQVTAETVVEEMEETMKEEQEAHQTDGEAPIPEPEPRPSESDRPPELPENARQEQEDTPKRRNRPRF